MIDSHCHLADEAFAPDVEAVVARAKAAGLSGALCILAAGSPDETVRGERLVGVWPEVRFGVGVHPHQAGEVAEGPAGVERLVRDGITAMPAARAIGEIGLDYHYDFSPRDVQREVFRVQLRLAREVGLPVIIHTRDAEADTLALLKEEGGAGLRGVIHCFTGSAAMAKQVLDRGLCVSFAGIVTFPAANQRREVVPIVPQDRLLVETDSPYLAPVPHRGKRNEPAWVSHVLESVARLRGVSPDAAASFITENFITLFRP